MKKLSVLILLSMLLTACSGERTPGEFDIFAKCLTDKDIVMYGADTCPHCQEQKKRFKGSFDLITYVECRKDPASCQKEKIEGYPTWVLPDGKHITGAQSLSELAEVSGCSL